MEHRYAAMVTASLAWDAVSPLEVAEKLTSEPAEKTVPIAWVAAASVNAWQKTPGVEIEAATAWEVKPDVAVTWSRGTVKVVAESPSPVLMSMITEEVSRETERGAAQAMAARRRVVAALNMVDFILLLLDWLVVI